MNYKLCESYNKYRILSKYDQNIHFIQIASCLHLKGNIADDPMQMDVHKALYPFYTGKKMPHVTVTITKKRFVGSNSQVYYYYENLHSRLSAHFQHRAFIFFQVSIAMICKERTIGLPWFSTKPQIMTLFY